MSNPSFLSADTSPISSVKSCGHLSNRNHEITSSQKRPATITTTAVAQPIRAEQRPPYVTDASTLNRTLSQLSLEVADSEVTHGHSAIGTPHLPATQFISHGLDSLPKDVATVVDSPKPLSPQHSSLSLSLNRTRPPLLTPSIRPCSTGSQFTSLGTAHNLSHSTDHLADPDRSDAYKRLASFGHLIGAPLYQRTKSQGATDHTRMSQAWDREGRNNKTNEGNATKVGEALTGARQEAFSEEKRNRSSSRTGNGRVEKRIEATLAKAEPASNTRSRKSSHILGLFKENTASQDTKKSQEKAKNNSGVLEDDTVSESIGADNEGSNFKQHDGYNRPIESAPGQGQTDPFSLEGKDRLGKSDGFLHGDSFQQFRRKSSAASTTSRPLLDISNESQNHGNNSVSPRVTPDDHALDVGDMSHFNIPQRLLEEIRSHHNLIAPLRERFRGLSNKATSADPGQSNTDSHDRLEPPTDNFNDQQISDSAGKVEEAEEDDEDGSDKEQISSALYYPHQGPSPSNLEDGTVDDTSHFEDSQINGEDHELKSPSPDSCNNDIPSEDVDITLQSQNKSRYLHGDLQKSWIHPPEPSSAKANESGTSSASESEYDSLDESARSATGEPGSLTDEAEITPTATPVAHDLLATPRLRKVRHPSTAPLGAVELKPYNHQVGGHTTVFRFSKRAVCKQLSNRENEFYEVVEREHPELLKFLPRYAQPFYNILPPPSRPGS